MQPTPVHIYIYWFLWEVNNGQVKGHAELASLKPIATVQQVAAFQSQIQSGIRITDQQGGMLIGSKAPVVLITNWKLLREDEVSADVLHERYAALASELSTDSAS